MTESAATQRPTPHTRPRVAMASSLVVLNAAGGASRPGRAWLYAVGAAVSNEKGARQRIGQRLVSGREHDAKPCVAAHHSLVGLGGAFEGQDLVHRPHAGPR